jgi:hypothetical protein
MRHDGHDLAFDRQSIAGPNGAVPAKAFAEMNLLSLQVKGKTIGYQMLIKIFGSLPSDRTSQHRMGHDTAWQAIVEVNWTIIQHSSRKIHHASTVDVHLSGAQFGTYEFGRDLHLFFFHSGQLLNRISLIAKKEVELASPVVANCGGMLNHIRPTIAYHTWQLQLPHALRQAANRNNLGQTDDRQPFHQI